MTHETNVNETGVYNVEINAFPKSNTFFLTERCCQSTGIDNDLEHKRMTSGKKHL